MNQSYLCAKKSCQQITRRRDVEIFIFQICEKYIFDFSTMSHYSKRSVRDMNFSERVHKLFFSERSLSTLQLSLKLTVTLPG